MSIRRTKLVMGTGVAPSLHFKIGFYGILLAVAGVIVFGFIKAVRRGAEPPPAAMCAAIFKSAVDGTRVLSRADLLGLVTPAKKCRDAGMFDKYLPTAASRYSLRKRTLELDGVVYPLESMVIRKGNFSPLGMGFSMPAVDLQVGSTRVQLRFVHQEDADKAFENIAESIEST